MTKYTKLHEETLKHLESFKGVHEVKELLQVPNKYGDNVSNYTAFYNYQDKHNTSLIDIGVRWDEGIMFIQNEGYFPFESFNDIKANIKKHTKIK